MLPWNVLGLWNAVIGFAILALSRDPSGLVLPAGRSGNSNRPIRSRIAIVMPVHNEDPGRTVGHLEETVASLDATGESGAFEVFLLSDTQRPATAALEQTLFDRWRRRVWPAPSGYITAAARKSGHKTGNLWDFLERHGQRFDHMLVLDADSVMSGAAILRLARVMEAHPEIGILQQLIVGLPSTSPFPRIFQFGMRHGMRAYTRRQRLVAGRLRPVLGPQRADPRRAVHGALPAAAAAWPAAARRPRAQPRPGRGGADAARRLAGARAAGGDRQLRGESADPVGFRQARPALVPGQLAVSCTWSAGQACTPWGGFSCGWRS